jgi:hypothetical protein
MKERALRIGLLLTLVVLSLTLLLIQDEREKELRNAHFGVFQDWSSDSHRVGPENIPYHPIRLKDEDLRKDPALLALYWKLEPLSSLIPYFNFSDVLYHRIPDERDGLTNPEELDAFKAFVKLADAADEAQLWKLTAHPNARVRTLALVAAYWRGNPQRLPGIFDMIGDRAETFPGVETAGPGGPDLSLTPRERRRAVGGWKHTVGNVAGQIIDDYLVIERCNDESRTLTENFRDYWAARSNRTHCLSWFQLALSRATQETLAVPPECLPAVKKLREQVDALEPPYRGWILLALTASHTWANEEDERAKFAGAEDIIRAAREIGRSDLMELFHCRFKSEDPDIRKDPKNPYGLFPYHKVCKLVLCHAPKIFRPEDADSLLALEQFHRGRRYPQIVFVSPLWAIAAADLVPKRAREILLAAMERFKDSPQYDRGKREQEERQDECRELAQAFWDHEGMAGVDVIKKWFRTDASKPVVERFFKWLHADASRRPLLEALISGDQ